MDLHSSSLVRHFQSDDPALAQQPDLRSRTAGVAVHIGQALLKNPEKCCFNFFRQASEVRRGLECGDNAAAFRKAVQIPRNR